VINTEKGCGAKDGQRDLETAAKAGIKDPPEYELLCKRAEDRKEEKDHGKGQLSVDGLHGINRVRNDIHGLDLGI
jgi:hypothetical protein